MMRSEFRYGTIMQLIHYILAYAIGHREDHLWVEYFTLIIITYTVWMTNILNKKFLSNCINCGVFLAISAKKAR